MKNKVKVLIQPIGEINSEIILKLVENLTHKLEIFSATTSSQAIPMPKRAFNPIRRQYYSPIILRELYLKVGDDRFDRILGVTSVDLYVKGLNFIFGQAQLGGKYAIISIYRLKPEFYGQPSNNTLLQERILKEAVHELGHTLGLRHCENRYCVMYFSNSILDTDIKGYRFCSRCEGEILRLL